MILVRKRDRSVTSCQLVFIVLVLNILSIFYLTDGLEDL